MDQPKLIVALDFDNKEQAFQLINQLKPEQCALKVGLEMFTLYGMEYVKVLIDKGFKVFLDLKYHDIPNTVSRACKAAAEMGVWMINIHSLGGYDMMKAASEAVKTINNPPLLIAVTVLTSMDQKQLQDVGVSSNIEAEAISLAKLAQSAGLDGVVCSAWESEKIKNQIKSDFITVTPGIRLAESPKDDQKRIMTPAEAIKSGSDYLVIGRPITRSSSPMKVVEDILKEIAHY